MSDFKKQQDEKERTRTASGGKCQFCVQVLALPPKKIKDLYDAFLDKAIDQATIYRVLTEWGILTSKTTINLHHNGSKGYASHLLAIKKAAGA